MVEKIRYSYVTPKGLYRPNCTFCQAANGRGLQAIAAEGATDGLYQVVKNMWMSEEGELLYGSIPLMFIHDEIVWESPDDELLGERARKVEQLMVDMMERTTPDVKAAAESSAMRRWNKYAESIWDGDRLVVWEEESVKETS